MAMLRVANCPSQDLALTNAAFVNEADAAFVPYAELGDLVLFTRPHPDVERGTVALNGVQRKLLRVSTGDSLRVEPFTLPSSNFNAAAMTVELEFTKLRTATDLNAAGRHEQVRTASWRKANAGRGRACARTRSLEEVGLTSRNTATSDAKHRLFGPSRDTAPRRTEKQRHAVLTTTLDSTRTRNTASSPTASRVRPVSEKKKRQVDAAQMGAIVQRSFVSQVFTVGQKAAVEYCGNNYLVTFNSMLVEGVADGVTSMRGVMTPETTFLFEAAHASAIKIANQKSSSVNSQLFKTKDFSFEKLGIGGLDKQFEDIFRRAFSSRVFPQSVVQRLGIHHVKGMLLHGPPGTGKTLIARQIGKMLNGKEPKICNGPEVMSKYVGQSEENIRALFADAEAEQKAKGDDSDLHIIIFDEIDAVCKARGSVSNGTGVQDSMVNQLLTKIDGVDALNNILLIGMTNRRDMLDEAILRPGRLEVHIEIGLPDEAGRAQILKIHSQKMSENEFLAHDVDVADLAKRTKNFSGAEIEGLVKSAVSFALARQVDFQNLGAMDIDEDNVKIERADFERALEEVRPAFGASTDTFERCRLNGIISPGERFEKLHHTCRSLVEQVRVSEKTPMLTCLLEGGGGSGKTALAATLAIGSEFPFTKLVSAETMVGQSEMAKCQALSKVFEDAYKSPLSMIVLDDIERLLEYVAIGPRFSNVVLQALLILLKRAPPPGRKLLVIGTTSLPHVFEHMGLVSAFNVSLHCPLLTSTDASHVLRQLGAFQAHELEPAVALLDEETPIKKLFMLLEMARHGGGGAASADGNIPLDRWITCMEDLAG